METTQALFISFLFFVKVGIFATFVVGVVATVKWLRENVTFFREEEEQDDLEWWKS